VFGEAGEEEAFVYRSMYDDFLLMIMEMSAIHGVSMIADKAEQPTTFS
jgi:hypothetical protein